MPRNTFEDFRNLLSQVEQKMKQATSVSCPHCGRALSVVAAGRAGAKRSAPKIKVARGKKAASKKGRRRGPARISPLVGLAMKYARAKHNGRIGDAYRDVKKAIAKQAKGKSPEEVKALKATWFRQQLAA
jgi:hypothetical protein